MNILPAWQFCLAWSWNSNIGHHSNLIQLSQTFTHLLPFELMLRSLSTETLKQWIRGPKSYIELWWWHVMHFSCCDRSATANNLRFKPKLIRYVIATKYTIFIAINNEQTMHYPPFRFCEILSQLRLLARMSLVSIAMTHRTQSKVWAYRLTHCL